MARQTLKYKIPNMKGQDVKDFQTMVTQKGFSVGSIDGKYGLKSRNACKAFQKANDLTADGICGAKTWAALEAAPEPGIPSNPSTKQIQDRLIEWGFGTIVGKADGKMGTKTKTAIKQFQSCMSLKPDGIVGKNTKAALWGEIIVPRISDREIMCQCVAAGKNYCNGYPKGHNYGISVRILAERIFREVEKKYPGTKFYTTSVATPTPNGSNAGGYRCSKWNKLRGGASSSQHIKGLAMDIYGKCPKAADSVIRQEIENVAMNINTYGGVGYGAAYIVHIDNRGSKARWKY